MIIIAPDDLTYKTTTPSIFLAGGISNCPDWQVDIQTKLHSEFGDSLDIINPRRNNWNMKSDDSESIKQIQWEKKYITYSNFITFWFPKETLCPITLMELGMALYSKNIISIGIESGYQRKLDVITQSRLVYPEISILDDFDSYVETTIKNIKENIATS